MVDLLSISRIGKYVAAVMFVIFAALSVYLFFKYDIRGIMDVRSGRGAQREIERLQEINAQTGRLRPDFSFTGSLSSDLSTSQELPISRKTKSESKRLRHSEKLEPPKIDNRKFEQSMLSSELSKKEGSEETTLLNQGGEETTILSGNAEDTVVLAASEETVILSSTDNVVDNENIDEDEDFGETMILTEVRPQPKAEILFEIKKQVIWYHTDEVLDID